MISNQTFTIEINQLQVGLYIHLDLGWMDHPFTVSNFKVKNEEQVAQIKKIGLKKLRYDPLRSDCLPLPAESELHSAEVSVTQPVVEGKKNDPNFLKEERLKQLKKAINENEKKFVHASDITRQISRNILTSPQTSIEQASIIVNELVNTALMEGDVAIHALNGNRSSDVNYQHTLNVTVLALMLAKSIDISREDAQLLGMAALFHDIGKAEITDKILIKKEPLTKSEQTHFEQHSEIGAKMAQEIGLPVRMSKIIMQHHEFADGSGYPKHLKANQTDPLARIISLVNYYDNLCNPNNFALAKTPYEALSHMYTRQRTKHDELLLKSLIKSLGIYPPGSIVQLTTGAQAIVISVNPNKPLRPFVMMYDPSSQRKEALILDLREEPSINISVCLRPNQLPPDVLEYLNPRKRICYFMDSELLKREPELNIAIQKN